MTTPIRSAPNPATAQQPVAHDAKAPERKPDDRATFRELDRNADGALSRLEVGVGTLRAGQGVIRALTTTDRFDTNADKRTSFQEFAGTKEAERLGSGLGDARTNLAGQLDVALPRDATLSPQLRERVVDRAARFEADAREMARTQRDPASPLGRLRGSLGEGFAPDAPIALHGVASHFEPETLQARVRDRQGQEHTFVRDSAGAWVERPDLQALHAAGRTPSADPGMQTRPDATATFGVATVSANGRVDVQTPDVSRFSHQPRANPFRVGDTVQVVEQTGTPRAATEGQAYVQDDRVAFGRLASTDGRGNWTVELTNPDGSVQRDANGKPVTRTLTDAQLREANNPTLLRDGDRVYDSTFNRADPAQRRMISAFDATPEAAELERTRPGPNASPAERAAWERRAIDAADNFLDSRMRYPIAADAAARARTERTEAEARVAELDTRIAAERAAGRPVDALTAQRTQETDRIARLTPLIEQRARYDANVAGQANIGAYFEAGAGECRHQAIAMQTLMQHLGIDARMTRGAANTPGGDYRGEHMWIEATLSDGSQMLVDPTWSGRSSDRPGALEPAYRNDRRRMEDPGDTISDYRRHFAALPERPRRIDDDERARAVRVL